MTEVPAETSPVASLTPPKKKRNHAKARVRIDRRNVLGKRIAELRAIFTARAGLDPADPDPVLAAAVEAAARLTGLAEDATAKAARHDPSINLDDLVRLQRVADLAVKRLRLDAHRKPTTTSLADIMRGAT
jgi:hypothetical protein